ncbi:MAG: hypothetical protein ACLTFB_02280 [Candidatus Phytoplasma pyri]|uniref:hypothetical protein n=1 Tax=Candidatus Phytoplasma pyri TaxID=47566 RepID=UPI003982EF32
MNKIKKIKYMFISFFLFSLLLIQSTFIASANNYEKKIEVKFEILAKNEFDYKIMYQKLWEEICIRKGYKQQHTTTNEKIMNDTNFLDEGFTKIFKKDTFYTSQEMFQEMLIQLEQKEGFLKEIFKESEIKKNKYTLHQIMQYLYFKNNDNYKRIDKYIINEKNKQYIINEKEKYIINEKNDKFDCKTDILLVIDVKDKKFKFSLRSTIWEDFRVFDLIQFKDDVYIMDFNKYRDFAEEEIVIKKKPINEIPKLELEDETNKKFRGKLKNQDQQEEIYYFNTIEIKKEQETLLKYEEIRKILENSQTLESKQEEFKKFLNSRLYPNN